MAQVTSSRFHSFKLFDCAAHFFSFGPNTVLRGLGFAAFQKVDAGGVKDLKADEPGATAETVYIRAPRSGPFRANGHAKQVFLKVVSQLFQPELRLGGAKQGLELREDTWIDHRLPVSRSALHVGLTLFIHVCRSALSLNPSGTSCLERALANSFQRKTP